MTTIMGQSINFVALRSAARVLTCQRSLAVPHFVIKDINDIDFRKLRTLGIRAIAFDKDNVLTAPYKNSIYPTIKTAWEQCKETFDGKVVIMSNSAGSSDDKGFREAVALERQLGAPVIKHGSKVCYSCWKIYNREGLTWRQLNPKKPSGGEALLLAVGCEAEAVAFVGDRLLTDVVFGNQNGFLTIHTQPLTEIGDNWMASKVRWLENHVLKSLYLRGVPPPIHPVASSDISKHMQT